MFKQMKNFSMLEWFYVHGVNYPTAVTLNYFWSFGFVSAMFFGVQLITGIFLAMHYVGDVLLAFNSVEHMMRDVSFGWLLRYMHANGASFFFIVVYMHMASGLFFGSFSYVQSFVWLSGMFMFILMMGTAFMGYVLPWGQMSYWGATVITNLMSAMPSMGDAVVSWVWGGFSVGAPTLTSFYCFHFLLPFVLLVFIILHLAFLHQMGSSSPFVVVPKDGVDLANSFNLVPLFPHFILKDLVSLVFFFFFYFFVVTFMPDLLGHSDNYMEANSLVTPEHIVPEWYFLPYYAILSSMPNKLLGMLAMFGSLVIVLLMPWMVRFFSSLTYNYNKNYDYFVFEVYVFSMIVGIFYAVVLLLGYLGAQPVEEPFVFTGQLLTLVYFICPFVLSVLSMKKF